MRESIEKRNRIGFMFKFSLKERSRLLEVGRGPIRRVSGFLGKESRVESSDISS